MGPKNAQKNDKGISNKAVELAIPAEDSKRTNEKHSESADSVFTKFATEDRPSGKYTTDKFGNTVLKAKAEEDAKLEAMRAAARAKRAEKEAAAQLVAETVTLPVSEKSIAALSVEDVRKKLEAGLKLTHKEKKLLSSSEKASVIDAQQSEEDAAGLSSFSLSAQANDLAEDAEGKTASSLDVLAASVSISAPSRPLLIDATVRLVYCRRYGLLGPNGRGKTTLLKYLAARKLPIPAGVDVMLVEQEVPASEKSVVDQVLEADTARSALIAEEALLTAEFEEQEHLLEQSEPPCSSTATRAPAVAWDESTLAAKLARYAQLGVELESGGADACEAKVRKILVGLGFTEKMQDGPSSTLSGGWRMRVALARALFLEPKLLLLDEPTNHLDLNAVLWLDDYLSNQWKHTLLVVSHDADFLDSVCTDIIHLDDAKLNYYSGSFTTFEGMKGQIESKKERDFALQQKTLKDLKATGLTVEKAEKKALQKLGTAMLIEKPREYKVTFTVHSPGEEGPGIDLLDVSFGFPARKAIFSGLRFRVNTHSRVAIVGPNGAGKSTLLKLMCGALAPTSGEVSRHNKLRVGVYNQHFEDTLNAEQSPIEFLTAQYDITVLEARKYLGMFGLDGARHTIRIGQLSGGQKARVVFASLSLLRPHLLILDEPTNHLDIESVDALIVSLKKYEGGVVLVSHDARLISAIECELWVCGDCPSGLRVERRGFDRYRLDVMQETRRLQEVAGVRAAARAAARKVEREKRLRRKAVGAK